ncbi:MAG: CPBP family intramembrane metalloprotease [Chitinophagaceae bacterium]|jgi:membrane protease YdiL (CAAX protease family)|nr:CPBP family intramembrane metalloprotease [Chitinophagaceae bacterium]
MSIRNLEVKKNIFWYIIALFFVSWSIQLLAIFIVGDVNKNSAGLWLATTMVSPFFVTLFFLYKNEEWKRKLLWKPNSKIFITSFLAVLIPILLGFSTLLILENFDLGKSSWFDFSTDLPNLLGGPFILGKGSQSWLLFILNVFLTGFLFALLNATVATGEEFAWRGLLQPLMMEKFGLIKGVTLLGIIWSFWHLPILLNGYNYPETPLLGGLILFPIRSIATSFFYVWLTYKSKSFIPASIAHGALNGIQTAVVFNMEKTSHPLYENIITIIVALVVGFFFLLLTAKSMRNNL